MKRSEVCDADGRGRPEEPRGGKVAARVGAAVVLVWGLCWGTVAVQGQETSASGSDVSVPPPPVASPAGPGEPSMPAAGPEGTPAPHMPTAQESQQAAEQVQQVVELLKKTLGLELQPVEFYVQVAMERSPAVRKAMAAVEAARAEADLQRMQVAQQVIQAYKPVQDRQGLMRDIAQDIWQRAQETGRAPEELMGENDLAPLNNEYRKALALFEAQVGLAGPPEPPLQKGPESPFPQAPGRPLVMQRPPLPLEDEKWAALKTVVNMEFEDTPLREILELISEQYEINIVASLDIQQVILGWFAVSEVPVKDALLTLTDLVPNLVFVLRDYGILATTRENAMTIPGPTIPPLGETVGPPPGGVPAAGR